MKLQFFIFHTVLLACFTHVSASEPNNPSIDYEGFATITETLALERQMQRVSEETFIRMAADPSTIVLDARSRDRYERIHVTGAIHLALTDFTEESLQQVIPDKNTRILIYCNNNFENESVNFASKMAVVALNIQTFINLRAYGYTNVHELGPKLDIHTTRIAFSGTDVSVDGRPLMATPNRPQNAGLRIGRNLTNLQKEE